MYCLGIESTAHTFGCAIVTFDGEVLSNEKKSFTTEEGGMKPFDVSQHHVVEWKGVWEKALNKANIKPKDISLVAFSQGPGLGPCLRIGAMVSRLLASHLSIPLVGVNHCVSHLEIAKLRTPAKDPVMLYASGANTQVIALEGGKYRVFGETLDIGIGNFIDTFARYMGLGFPGGPKIEALAKNSNNCISLPYVVKGMDTSFGGLLTNLKQKYDSKKYIKEDLCFSLQETAFASLIEVSERAMAHCNKKELVLGGGVGCNTRLQEMCKIMCEERDATFYVPEKEFLIDNAAMIAWQGIIEHKAGKTTPVNNSPILPYWRTDEVEVTW